MTFPEVKLAPGERLIDETGRSLDTHPFAYWPDYYVVNRYGDVLTRHEYHQLPPAARKKWCKVRYAVVVDQQGNTIRREYRDVTRWVWNADTNGNEVDRQAPETWPDFVGVHKQNYGEISAVEYWSLPEQRRADYHIVHFYVLRNAFGPFAMVYNEQEFRESGLKFDSGVSLRPYYEPPLVSTSPADAPLDSTHPEQQTSAPRESRTPLADQIKDEYKLHVDIRTYPIAPPQTATGTT